MTQSSLSSMAVLSSASRNFFVSTGKPRQRFRDFADSNEPRNFNDLYAQHPSQGRQQSEPPNPGSDLSTSAPNVHSEDARTSFLHIKNEGDVSLTPNRSPLKEKKPHPSGSCKVLLSLQSHVSVSDRLSSIKISPRSTQNDEDSGSESEYSIGDPMDLDSSRASIEEDLFWLGPSVDQRQSGQLRPLDETTPHTKEAYHTKTHSESPNLTPSGAFDKGTQTTLIGELKFSRPSPNAEQRLSTKPLLERLTPDGEADFFYQFYHALDHSFDLWQRNVGYVDGKTRELDKRNPNDATLDLPLRIERHIIFGQRPDGKGFWRGYLRLGGKYTELVKLTSWIGDEEFMWGVEIGKIDDFECLDGAILFFGIDRKVYYTDGLGHFDQDDEGVLTFPVMGGYDLRQFRKANVLDPFAED